MSKETVAEKIIDWRAKRGITQRDAARLFGLSPAALSKIEHGGGLRSATLARIFVATGGELSPNFLILGEAPQ